jgi:deoxyribonuclease IV
MTLLRVRAVLDGITGTGRRPLLKFIPEYTIPEDTKGTFPATIMSCFEKEQRYSITGLLTEELILLDKEKIDIDNILEAMKKYINLNLESRTKISKSKTTKDYIEKINYTKALLKTEMKIDSKILKNQEYTYKCVQGHPDGVYKNFVLEIKTSSRLDKDIQYFLLQLTSYLALGKGTFTKGILVLPLQKSIIVLDYNENLNKYLELFTSKAEKLLEKQNNNPVMDINLLLSSSLLINNFCIGTHVAKQKTLLQTVSNMNPGIPYQIFLGSTQSSKLNIDEEDLKMSNEFITKNNIIIYIHTPYIINLSSQTPDNYQKKCLILNLQYGYLLGAKGVVVHTGKHTKDSYEIGVGKMRKMIEGVLPYAQSDCPLLLETPSGQGTETLQDKKEFLDFVESFHSDKIGVCVDTCHVFANGHEPYDYVFEAITRKTLKLVHFNDSKEDCGSCKDRHAQIGLGKIGINKMSTIAELCKSHNIDMLIE